MVPLIFQVEERVRLHSLWLTPHPILRIESSARFVSHVPNMHWTWWHFGLPNTLPRPIAQAHVAVCFHMGSSICTIQDPKCGKDGTHQQWFLFILRTIDLSFFFHWMQIFNEFYIEPSYKMHYFCNIEGSFWMKDTLLLWIYNYKLKELNYWGPLWVYERYNDVWAFDRCTALPRANTCWPCNCHFETPYKTYCKSFFNTWRNTTTGKILHISGVLTVMGTNCTFRMGQM